MPQHAEDLICQLVHRVMSTVVCVCVWQFGTIYAVPTPDPSVVRGGPWQTPTWYARLQSLFWLLQNILLKFWLNYSPDLLIVAHPIHGPIKLGNLSTSSWHCQRWPSIRSGRGSMIGREGAALGLEGGSISSTLLYHFSRQSSSEQCPLAS